MLGDGFVDGFSPTLLDFDENNELLLTPLELDLNDFIALNSDLSILNEFNFQDFNEFEEL